MKKLIPVLLFLLCCPLWLSAKEYSFTITPLDKDISYHYLVKYDTYSKNFSLILEEDDYTEFYYLFFGISPTEDEEPERIAVYENQPDVSLYLSEDKLNWGGNGNELLFVNKEGYIIFGAYVDSVKFDTDNRRKSYALINTKAGIEKVQCCAMLPKNYEPIDELIKFANPVTNDSSSSASQSSSSTNSTSNPSIKYYVTKVFGNFDVKSFAYKFFSQIEKELKSMFQKEVVVQNLSSAFKTYDVYNPALTVNGRQPSSIRFSKLSSKPLNIQYGYTFKFDTASEAESFARSLLNAVSQQCADVLTASDKTSEDTLCSYIGDYRYNGITYTVQVSARKESFGEYFSLLTISIFLPHLN